MRGNDFGNLGSKVLKRVSKKSNFNQQEQTQQPQMYEIRTYEAEEERRRQVEQVEAKHRFLQAYQESDTSRLRDAIMLSEIIGQPRCKERHNRRTRRG